MQIFMKTAILCTCLIGATVIAKQSTEPSLSEAWKVEGLEIPESAIEVRQKGKSFFLVSLIKGDFMGKDGNGDIAKISPSGELLDAQWASGLNAPKGMAKFKDKLYVSDIDEVVVIDMKNGDVIEHIPVPGSVFLNDVAANQQGDIFVSDTGVGKIFRIRNSTPEIYLENLARPNGLLIKRNQLVVGAGSQLLSFNSAMESTLLSELSWGLIDGIAKVKHGNHLVSIWEGQIYWIAKDGSQKLLLDLTADGIFTADFTYSKKHKLLVVPNFFANTVTAYRLNY